MLETLQKATPEDNPDTKFLAEALDRVKAILGDLDKITGFEENKLSLETLNDMIVWKENEVTMVCAGLPFSPGYQDSHLHFFFFLFFFSF